jgi:hypothetical protein
VFQQWARAHIGTHLIILSASIRAALAAGDDSETVTPLSRLATPAQVYQAACASCHGTDGTGALPAMTALAIPLPDFTDCSFASREPAADWFAVAHAGGPVRGFDRMMPAFGLALTPEQLEMAVSHVQSFCDDDAWPRGELNLPRPLFTEKAYPEDEFVVTTGVAAEGSGAVETEILYEKRFGARNQVELAVPVVFQERSDASWQGGIGDVAIGFKRALVHGWQNTMIVSLGAEVVLPTGNRDDGFGTGTTIFEPFLAYAQILPAEFFAHLFGAVELPVDPDRAGREGLWRVALGRSFVQGQFGRTWSPMIEVLGSRELESGHSAQWDLVPQFQVTLNTRQHIMANAGVRIPLTDSTSRPTEVVAYLLWDWFDGGFFEGW